MGVNVLHQVVVDRNKSWIYKEGEEVLFETGPGRGDRIVSSTPGGAIRYLHDRRCELVSVVESISDLIEVIRGG